MQEPRLKDTVLVITDRKPSIRGARIDALRGPAAKRMQKHHSSWVSKQEDNSPQALLRISGIVRAAMSKDSLIRGLLGQGKGGGGSGGMQQGDIKRWMGKCLG